MTVNFMLQARKVWPVLALLVAACAPTNGAIAQNPASVDAAAPVPEYADIVELALASDIVARVAIRDQAQVKAERAPGLEAGKARLYIEAETQALLAGDSIYGEGLAFLVDLPFTDRGKAPRIEKQTFLVFADLVRSRPGTVQLVGPSALQPATPQIEAATRRVLTQIAQGKTPPTITGVKEVMSVPGNLAGESETQIFLETDTGEPVSLSVVRRPSMAPHWGVSWSEIVDASVSAPTRETLEWYALACHLPSRLPRSAFLQADTQSVAQAEADYRMIIDSLGACRGG